MEAQGQGTVTPAAASAPPTAPAPAEAKTAAPETPQAEAPKPEADFSTKFAALTRKERQVLEREKRAKAELAKAQAELEAKRADPQWKEYESWREVKSNPRQHGLKGLELLGLSYKDITDIVLNDGKVPVEKQLDEIRAQFAERDRQAEEAQKRAAEADRQNAINQYRQSIRAHVEKEGDAYELIRVNNAYDLILDTAVEYYGRTGLIADVNEVCKFVEEDLEKRLDSLAGLKKFQSKYKKGDAPSPSNDSSGKATTTTAPKTLTNTNVAGATPVTSEDISLLDPEKRRAWSAAKLKALLAQQTK